MNDLPESPRQSEAERKRIMRSRNIVLGLVLAGFAILTFAISIAKMS